MDWDLRDVVRAIEGIEVGGTADSDVVFSLESISKSLEGIAASLDLIASATTALLVQPDPPPPAKVAPLKKKTLPKKRG